MWIGRASIAALDRAGEMEEREDLGLRHGAQDLLEHHLAAAHAGQPVVHHGDTACGAGGQALSAPGGAGSEGVSPRRRRSMWVVVPVGRFEWMAAR